MRDESMKQHKETIQEAHANAEGSLLKQHKDFVEFETRKFRRRKLLQYHQLEQDLLKDVTHPSLRFLFRFSLPFSMYIRGSFHIETLKFVCFIFLCLFFPAIFPVNQLQWFFTRFLYQSNISACPK